jgi:hypothetical protein
MRGSDAQGKECKALMHKETHKEPAPSPAPDVLLLVCKHGNNLVKSKMLYL